MSAGENSQPSADVAYYSKAFDIAIGLLTTSVVAAVCGQCGEYRTNQEGALAPSVFESMHRHKGTSYVYSFNRINTGLNKVA